MIVTPRGETVTDCTFEHEIDRPHLGWAEHDAEKVWWGDFARMCRTLLQQSSLDPRRILAVGCSTFVPSVLPVDGTGRPLRQGILYTDTRTIDSEILDEIEAVKSSLEEKLGANASSRPYHQPITLTQILWIKRHEPEIFKKAARFLCVHSYVTYRLTGNYVIDHASARGRGLLYSFDAMEWNEAACREIGIGTEQLPRLCYAQEVAGKLTAEAAAETGLPEGIPVAVGTADGEATTVSLGALKMGGGMINYGTSVGLVVFTNKEVSYPGMTSSRSTISKEMYSLGGTLSNGAGLTKWFRDNFGQTEVEQEQQTGVNAYQSLSKIAGGVKPGSEGLIVLPYFSGERFPFRDTQARGMVFGLTLRHSRAHIYRAILEGVAFAVRHILDTMKGLGVTVKDVVMVGGGTQNDVWTQIMSDVTRLEQILPPGATGSEYGSAYLAGMAAGVLESSFFDKPADSGQKVVRPDPANEAVYDKHYQIYRSLYPKVADEMHVLE